MIIIGLTGGLGNQMFQYAFGRFLALQNKVELKYHFVNALFNTQRRFELGVFDIQAREASSDDLKKLGVVQNRYVNRILYLLDDKFRIRFNKHIVTQRFPYTFNKLLLDTPHNSYIQGYFTDERYFIRIKNNLKKDFTILTKLDTRNLKIIQNMHRTNAVSIHVRRGDYITNKIDFLQFIGTEYYIKAINHIRNQVQSPHFYIFSDDINWCKVHFRDLDNVYFIDHNVGRDSYKDMVLMSQCKHNIIANSTFSWWGMWLNENPKKICIQPK